MLFPANRALLVSCIHLQMQALHRTASTDAEASVEELPSLKGPLFEAWRQQQGVTLSSCEAELFALQAISQEAIAFSSFVHRVYYGLGEADEKETPAILVESDSASALDLLKGLDIPRRSRHVEVRISWLREKLEKDQLRFVHRDGVSNVADLFTKCLSTKDFERHRKTLGFGKPEVPLYMTWWIARGHLCC